VIYAPTIKTLTRFCVSIFVTLQKKLEEELGGVFRTVLSVADSAASSI
jgi:hypothetical protein